MASPSSPAVPWRGRWRMMIAGIVFLAMVIGATGFWLRGDVLIGREERLVRRALAEGGPDQASPILEQWLKSSPDSAEAHFYKARIAWARNDLPTVDQELARARTLGYPMPPLARLRGLLLARGNQTAEAERLLRQAIESDQGPDPEVAEALARIYLGAFRLDEAADIIDRWIRQAPGDARPYLLRTEIDIRTQAEPEAIIGHYRAALERDPSLDQARRGLAEQLRINGRHTEAAAEYALYLARKPNDPAGYVGAGENAIEMGNLADAAPLLDRALSLAPRDFQALAARATLELRQGHLEAALRDFDEALKSDPFDHWKHYQRMLILARLGKTAEANAERQVVERIKNDLARFSQISRDLVRNPLDTRLRAEAALWLMEHGHDHEAVDWANLVLQSDPSHRAMNRLLADYYRKNGQPGLANFHEVHAADSSARTGSTP